MQYKKDVYLSLILFDIPSSLLLYDQRLNHDRLLLLIMLFEYRNTGTRVVLVHNNSILQGPTIHEFNNMHDSHIIPFKHAYFT